MLTPSRQPRASARACAAPPARDGCARSSSPASSSATVLPSAGMQHRAGRSRSRSRRAARRAISPSQRPTATSGSGSSARRTATSVLTKRARRSATPAQALEQQRLFASSCASRASRSRGTATRRSAPSATPGAPPSASTHKPGVVGERRAARRAAPHGAPWPARSRRRCACGSSASAMPSVALRDELDAERREQRAQLARACRVVRREDQPHRDGAPALSSCRARARCARDELARCPCRRARAARPSRRA